MIYGERDGPWRVCVCTRERTSRRYQDVGFRGTPKGSSPFLSESSSSSSSSLMCMPCFYLLFPPRASIFSFAGRSPLHLPHAPTVHSCDARFYFLARLQRRRNTIHPARKWRNYIRGRVEEEERKSQRRGGNGACEARARSLASAENAIRKGGFRELLLPSSGIGRERKSRGDTEHAVVRPLPPSSRQWRDYFPFVLFKVACMLAGNRKRGNRNESLIYRGYTPISGLAEEISNLQSSPFS